MNEDTGDAEASGMSVLALVTQIFACSADVAELVVRRARLRSYPERTLIVRQGERVLLAYLVVAGRAQALLYTAEGQVVLLHEFSVGDFFGALGELEPVDQDADVITTERVRTLNIQAADLVTLAQRHGCIGLALSRMLLRRLRRTTFRMYERSAISAVGRVYAELLRQARLKSDFAISPPPVLAELALKVGTTRETASRAVNSLERRGIIRRDATTLRVIAPARLEGMVI
jgi:CRP-like cAMP-binding protein